MLLCIFAIAFSNKPVQAQVSPTILIPDTVLAGQPAMFIIQRIAPYLDQAVLWKWEQTCYSCDTVQCYDYSTADTIFHTWEDTGHHQVTLIYQDTTIQKQVYVLKWYPGCSYPLLLCEDLIFNGSFEDYINMPDCDNQINLVCAWDYAKGKRPNSGSVFSTSPLGNYFHTGHAPPSSCAWDLSPTTSSYATGDGFCPSANSQDAYVSFFSYNHQYGFSDLIHPDWTGSSYVQQKLSTPLVPGHTYTLSFYINLADASTVCTSFEVAFSPGLPEGTHNTQNHYRLKAPAASDGHTEYFPPTLQLTGWHHYTRTFTYTSSSPATYVTIGNFQDMNNLSTTNVYPNFQDAFNYQTLYGSFAYPGAHSIYLLDEFSLIDITPSPCCDPDVYMHPNVGQTYSNASQYPTTPGLNYLLKERLYIDQNTTYSNSTFVMWYDAQIEVANGKRLIFQNCTIKGCDFMWKFIDVFGPGTEIEMIDCVVMDAETAIDARAGATVKITGTQFINNYKSIYLHGYTTVPLTFHSNTFTSNGNMKPPLMAQRSYIHLQLNDVAHANISPSTYAQKNVYSYATYGIFANNTEIRLGHSDFNQIRNYHNQVGGAWSVYAVNGTNQPMRYLDMANSSTGPCYFANCDNGVYAALNLRVEITGSQFYWIKETGIKINRLYNFINVPVYGRLMDNYLITYGNGIEVQSMYESNFLAQNNELISDGKNLNNSGIYINKGPDLYKRCLDSRKILLKGNTITGYGSGIRSLNASCLAEVDNNITMGGNALGEFRGIFNLSSQGTHVYRNTITGQGLDWRWSGIRNDIAPGNYVSCNDIENTGNGLYFSGIGYQTIYRNTIEDANNGVLLNYGITGDVIASGLAAYNRWQGSINNHFHTDNSNGNFSPYYFDPTYLGQPEYPSVINSVSNISAQEIPALNAVTTGLYNQSAFCQREFFMTYTGVLTTILWDGSPDKMEEMVLSLIEEAPEFSPYHTEATRAYRQIAYEILKKYPGMADTNILLEGFRDNMDGTTAEEIYNAQKNMTEGNWSGVTSFITPVVSDDLYMKRLRKVFGYVLPIYMNYDTTGACIPLPLDELDSLSYYAGLCPYEYDKIPVLSRFVLEAMGIPYTTHECETVPDYPLPKKHSVQQADKMLVFPNPASRSITIQIPQDMEKESCLLVIFDATGKQIYSSIYAPIVDISKWENGLYFCRINNDKQSYQSSFIILK